MPNRLLLIATCFSVLGFVGCSGAIDKVVDSRVSSLVDEQNKKLPADISDGVTLNKVEYDKDSNLLTLLYTCVNAGQVKGNLKKLEFQTNKRARNDGSITQALERGIKVEHHFFAEGQQQPFHVFETKAK